MTAQKAVFFVLFHKKGGKEMKHYGSKKHFLEDKSGAFRCNHCRSFVVLNRYMGTQNRNHCNFCLWSRHVDIQKGDRASECWGGMLPIGLTLKREGFARFGELMLIHVCQTCLKISINRIAADDSTDEIMTVFKNSQELSEKDLLMLENNEMQLLADKKEVEIQLFGK